MLLYKINNYTIPKTAITTKQQISGCVWRDIMLDQDQATKTTFQKRPYGR
jgi:hypothetical protein